MIKSYLLKENLIIRFYYCLRRLPTYTNRHVWCKSADATRIPDFPPTSDWVFWLIHSLTVSGSIQVSGFILLWNEHVLLCKCSLHYFCWLMFTQVNIMATCQWKKLPYISIAVIVFYVCILTSLFWQLRSNKRSVNLYTFSWVCPQFLEDFASTQAHPSASYWQLFHLSKRWNAIIPEDDYDGVCQARYYQIVALEA